MEMQEGRTPDVAASWWNELPEDFQTEILSWLPVESVYRYAIACKEWNELLSSNYFITRWGEQPINGKQLLLCHTDPKVHSMAFCFYRRTWIKSFTFSFLEDWARHICSTYSGILCEQSAAGHIFVSEFAVGYGRERRLCNPYTRSIVGEYNVGEYNVVQEENNSRAFKVVATRNAEAEGRMMVKIYEASQKRWNIAGYIEEDFIIHKNDDDILFLNGSFYTSWILGRNPRGIVVFTIPLDGSGAGRIPVLLVPYPETLQRRDYTNRPRIFTCGSRLLVIAKILTGAQVVVVIWELKIEKESGSWKWVEIAGMPPPVWVDMMDKFRVSQNYNYRLDACIGVGDYLCFLPEWRPSLSFDHRIEVLTYNLVHNTWNWLPSSPKFGSSCTPNCRTQGYTAIAFDPTASTHEGRLKIEQVSD